MVRSLHRPSALGRLWESAACDRGCGRSYGFCRGCAICHPDHDANRNLDTHAYCNLDAYVDSDRDRDANAYGKPHPDADTHAYADTHPRYRSQRVGE